MNTRENTEDVPWELSGKLLYIIDRLSQKNAVIGG
jgi:hypothetical protein